MYTNLFLSMELGVVYQDAEGKILKANPAAENILGYTLEELKKLTFFSPEWNAIKEDRTLFPGEEHPAIISLRTGKPVKEVVMGITNPKTGKQTWISINSYPEFDEDKNKPYQVLVILRDVTKEKQIAKSLLESESRYKTLIECSTDSMFLSDMQGNLLETNDVACRQLGYSKSELLSLHITDIDLNAAANPDFTAFWKSLQPGKSIMIESLLNRKDGATIPVEIHVGAINFGSEKYILGFARDISERIRTNKMLEESEKKLRRSIRQLEVIINTLPGLVSVVDTEFNVIMANHELIRIFGNSDMNEIIGKKCYAVRKCRDSICPQCGIQKSFETKQLISRVSTPEEEKQMGIATKAYAVPLMDENGQVWGGVEVILDITDLRTAEKTARENEQLLNLALEGTNAGMWDWHIDEGMVYFNDKWLAITEYDGNQIHSLSSERMAELTHPDDLLKSNALIKDYFEGKTDIYECESRIKHKNGQWIHILSKGKISERDRNGNPTRIVGTFIDNSEKKKAEEELMVLKFGIDHSMIAVFSINDEGKIIYVNDQACRSLGYSTEELLSMSIIELDPNFDQKKWQVHRTKTKELGSRIIETLHKKKDGTYLPVEVTINSIRFGNKDYSFSFAKDITERKKVETLLRNNEAQLLKAAQIAKLGYWELDMINNVFTFNDQFYAIYRTTVEKVGGYQIPSDKYVELFVHPDDVERYFTNDHTTYETNEPFFTHRVEHRMLYGDGETGYIAVRYYIVTDEDGRKIKSIGVNQDITAQKIIENELLAAKLKAEENDKFKTSFLNNMSHEIRTPLNVIVGYAGLINEGGYSVDELKSLTDPIFRSTQQLQKIIDDILDISRIETGQMTLQIGKTDLNDLVEQVIDEQRLRAESKKLSLLFSKKLHRDTSTTNTDSGKVKQVINNLVTNAIKYTKKGKIEVTIETRKSDYLFAISDTGDGIEKKYHSVIFERFQRLDSIMAKNYHSTTEGGTGLGLAISKGIVDFLGGKIWLESEVGKGTTFYFTIPRG